MAISLGHRHEGWMGAGTLARSSVLGSAPRTVAEDVREAEWTPDGSDLAVVRQAGTLEHLEFPLGTVLYKTSGFITDIRFSRDGSRIAFADHPLFADDAGAVSVVDRKGERKVLAGGYTTVRGLAWSADGTEIWFTATKDDRDAMYAVTPSGALRVVWTTPSFAKLLDIAPDGRVLLGRETSERRVEALMTGATEPVDVTLRTSSASQWIAADGSMVTLADQNTTRYSSYLRKAGAAPVLLGDGQPHGVSDDGRWLLALPVDGAPMNYGAGESGLPGAVHGLMDIVLHPRWLSGMDRSAA